jgi:DNA-binding NtrC family response regulator
MSRPALELLMGYSWPGNVRELENAIERAVVLSRKKTIAPEDFPFQGRPSVRSEPDATGNSVTFRIGTPLESVERTMMEEALRHTQGDKEAAAALLGISSRTIYRKLAEKS